MTDTANLGLPCIDAAQAQKHLTHNEALRVLDTLVQLAVLDRDLSAPPGSPGEGQRWIVKATGTGTWAGHDSQVAAWQDGGWQFSTPQVGWLAYVIDEGAIVTWSGSTWIDVLSTITALQNLTLLGVGTTADGSNPFSAKLNSALWMAKTVADGGSGDLRCALSKESAAKTLSILLQDNASGRAEMGLTGDDDFHFKVSPDGSTWHESIRIAAATGKVSFPISGGPREVLSADRTYYVRTDGSDSNDGLSNTSGGAFLTIQKALDVVLGTLDLYGFDITIQVADGTYTGKVSFTSPQVGAGAITIQGNAATPSNVLVDTNGAAFSLSGGAVILTVKDMKISINTMAGQQFSVQKGALLNFGNVEFGASTAQHIFVADLGVVNCIANYAISGSASSHWAISGGSLRCQSKTITLSGTPAFSAGFANANRCGVCVVNGNTFAGSATGPRYSVATNGVIDSGGATFPGNSAGTTTSGGQYA
jgi:hypothetical protein